MKPFLIFSFLFLSIIANSQSANRIKFSYDSAGNQERRFICLCSAKTSNDSIYKTIETIVEDDLIKDTQFEQISYYPNPVREELYVKWTNNIDNPVIALELYSLTGQLLRSYDNLKDVEKTSVAFQNYPLGYYNLLLVYADGDRKLLKIVKQ